MFERTYAAAMRCASRIFFAAALLLLLFGIVHAVESIGRFGPENDLHPRWLEIVSALMTSASWAIWPFFAAAALHRADGLLRRLGADTEHDA
jgi:hypothetical protein